MEEIKEFPELPPYARRDLFAELRMMGFTSDQCSEILDWTEKLPIHIMGVDCTKVSIQQGIVKVEKNEEC
jgi:hypothetical protein